MSRARTYVVLAVAVGVVAWALHRPAARPSNEANAVDAGAKNAGDAALARAAEVTPTRLGPAEVDAGEGDADDATLDVDAGVSPGCAAQQRRSLLALDAWFAAEKKRVDALGLSGKAREIAQKRFGTIRMHLVGESIFPTPLLPLGALCRSTPGGTWAVAFDAFTGAAHVEADLDDAETLDALSVESRGDFVDFEIEGRATLHFEPATPIGGGDSGAATIGPFRPEGRAPFKIETTNGGMGAKIDILVDLQTGDTDGDGRDEALLVIDHATEDWIDPNHSGDRRSLLYTHRGDALVVDPRAPANLVLLALRDVDGDGRADLLSPSPYVATVANAMGYGHEVAGPLLLAHAVAGGNFSISDAAAVRHARTLCPTRPDRLVSDDAGLAGVPFYITSNRDEGIRQIVCARLWGVPASVVAGWIRHESGPSESKNESEYSGLLRWASATPPLDLR